MKNKNKKEYNGFKCIEWLSFEDFVNWAETHEYKDNMHLLPKNGNKPFTPDNCYFSERTYCKSVRESNVNT